MTKEQTRNNAVMAVEQYTELETRLSDIEAMLLEIKTILELRYPEIAFNANTYLSIMDNGDPQPYQKCKINKT